MSEPTIRDGGDSPKPTRSGRGSQTHEWSIAERMLAAVGGGRP
jgi:hypothetical protein